MKEKVSGRNLESRSAGMYRAGLVAVIAVFLSMTGCTHTIALNPNIGPTANIAQPVKLKVGLYFPMEFREYILSDSPDLDRYVFEIGSSLESIVKQSVSRVFTEVVAMESDPMLQAMAEQDIDLVAIPKVNSARIALNVDEGPIQDEAQGSTSITIELMFFDKEMIGFTTVLATGSHTASERIGFFSRGQKEFTVSIEEAVNALSNDLVRQLYGNYDIRKKGDVSRWNPNEMKLN